MIWTSRYSSCANPHVYSFVDICCSCLVAQAPKCSWFNHPPYCWPRPLHFHPHKILPDLQSGAHAKDRNCTLPRLNRSQSWKHRQPNLKAITRNDSKWFQFFPTEKQLETIWTQQNPGKPLRKSASLHGKPPLWFWHKVGLIWPLLKIRSKWKCLEVCSTTVATFTTFTTCCAECEHLGSSHISCPVLPVQLHHHLPVPKQLG